MKRTGLIFLCFLLTVIVILAASDSHAGITLEGAFDNFYVPVSGAAAIPAGGNVGKYPDGNGAIPTAELVTSEGTTTVELITSLFGAYSATLQEFQTMPEHNGSSPIHYVSPTGGDQWPYTNWLTAAKIIQNAVDTANSGDKVLVANGSYSEGGAMTPENRLLNRVMINKKIAMESENGRRQLLFLAKDRLVRER